MLRPAVHLTKEEYEMILVPALEARADYLRWEEKIEAGYRFLAKITEAISAGERVIICPEKLGLAPSNGQARPAETPKLAGMLLDDAIRRVFVVTQCKAMTAPHVTSELIRQGWDGASRMQHATLLGRVRNALANQVQFTRVARGNYRPVADTE
jgi:hypothetical protein